MDFFTKQKEEVLKLLDVKASEGLSQNKVTVQAEKYGVNSFTKEKPESMIKRILEVMGEPMTIMLMIAAVITAAVNIAQAATGKRSDILECIGIFVAIFISAAITVFMENKSARAFEALSKINDDILVTVIREGKVQVISQKSIVVGDIVHVEAGSKIPADGRLLESVSLYSDESSLTGESAPVVKDATTIFSSDKVSVAERSNMLYSGCFITSGHGKLVVTAVGDKTEFGKIAQELSKANKQSTPLQEKLSKLGKAITILGSIAAGLIFFIQILIFVMNDSLSLETILEAFIASVVLIVAAVPEGIPTIVAVALSINVIKMSKQNALVKKIIACETIGCINVICSDKTGTLTENRMTVSEVYNNGSFIKPENLHHRHLLTNFCINSTADIMKDEEKMKFVGNPTECSLLVAASKAGYNYKDIRDKIEIVHIFPFSSETKNMTTVIKDRENKNIIYSKGSPEKILSMCDINRIKLKEIEEEIKRYQDKAYRIVAFAHKEQAFLNKNRNTIENSMIFDGFVIITDPLRNDVYESIKECRRAGIELKMLTGDNINTAIAIANQLDILNDDRIAIEAKAIENISNEELAKMLPSIAVIARSTPIIKMRVVNALKQNGNVVAVTGDGINDAPAIKNADVGMAMGISGTDVCKEASDIVLLDDSFTTIVRAVKWGRGIYENLQRFIKFQLTVNVSAVSAVLFSVILGLTSPFTTLQLLWINIIMDGPPALVLGLEPINDDLMSQPPTKRNASIVSKEMLELIIFNGLFIAVIFMFQSAFNFLGGTKEEQPTILFTSFIIFQLFNAFNSRKAGKRHLLRNLSKHKMVVSVFACTFLLQIVITQFGGPFFQTVPLSLVMWIKIVLLAGISILILDIIG